MAKELVPITEFNVGLPEYVPAEQVNINMHAIKRIAGWGCMRMVDIVSYKGETTPRTAGVMGVDNQGTAVKGGTASPEEIPRGAYELQYGEREFDTDDTPYWWNNRRGAIKHLHTGHSRPDLTLKLNLPEIQQRLQDKNAILRDPGVWASEIHMGLGEGLRTASKHHLIRTPPSLAELAMTVTACLPVTAAAAYSANLIPSIDSDARLSLSFGITGAFIELAPNIIKAINAKYHDLRTREACYSLIPGMHVDRLAAVGILTRMHQLCSPLRRNPSSA